MGWDRWATDTQDAPGLSQDQEEVNQFVRGVTNLINALDLICDSFVRWPTSIAAMNSLEFWLFFYAQLQDWILNVGVI